MLEELISGFGHGGKSWVVNISSCNNWGICWLLDFLASFTCPYWVLCSFFVRFTFYSFLVSGADYCTVSYVTV